MIVAGLAAVLALNCTNSTNPSDEIVTLEPLEGVAKNISLRFYCDSTGIYLGSQDLDGEGIVNMYIEPYDESLVITGYYIYASCPGYLTELYHCGVGEAVKVDLDSCPDFINSISGTITIEEPECETSRAAFHYFSNSDFRVFLPDGRSGVFQTDDQGRFLLGNLPEGTSVLRIEYGGQTKMYDYVVETAMNYHDIRMYTGIVVYAPNIYLYPEQDRNVQVRLGFPEGGKVIKSEPEYNNGWHVFVTSQGVIDSKYNYLFYEAKIPHLNNYERCWVFSSAELSVKLPELLYNYGFEGREIDDFMEFWLPILNKYPYYAFYPQEVDEMISLEITPQPESLLRVLFYVQPFNTMISLPEPVIGQRLERTGFSAVEWGVTGSPELVER